MKWKLILGAVILAGLILFVWAAYYQAPKEEQPTQTVNLPPFELPEISGEVQKQKFFLELNSFLKAKPFTLKNVEEISGESLMKQDLGFYKSSDTLNFFNAGISSIELRLPTNAPDGILIINLIPAFKDYSRIELKEILDLFGKNPKVDLPAPEAIGRVPVYYIYKIDGQEVRFGFDGSKPPILTTVVIDRITD